MLFELLSAFVSTACDKTGGYQAAPRTAAPLHEPRSHAATHAITLDLNGVRIAATLPNAWQMLPEQSDPTTGLVAFTIPWQAPAEQVHSLYFDATADLTMPSSPAELAAKLFASEACEAPAACRELGRATLRAGLMLSIEKPHAVYVESWTKASSGRAVRCGAEVSDLAAPAGRTWLEDESAVQRARLASEAICSSVTVTP